MSLVPRHPDRPFDGSPGNYVWHLARYIRDPSTIRARTIDLFGRAPDLKLISATIEAAAAYKKPRSENCLGVKSVVKDDGSDFVVRGIRQPEPEREPPAPIMVTIANDQGQHEVPIVTWRDVVSAVARDFGFTFADLVGGCRLRPIMLARRTAAFVLHKRGSSFPQVGRWLGVDHSTVIHAVRQFEQHATPDMWAVAERYILPSEVAA